MANIHPNDFNFDVDEDEEDPFDHLEMHEELGGAIGILKEIIAERDGVDLDELADYYSDDSGDELDSEETKSEKNPIHKAKTFVS
jgi:hypothetical protein